MKRFGFLQDVGLFALGHAFAGLVMVLYVFTAARLLGPAEFGLFQSVMGAFGILIAAGSPLNIAAVHSVASAPDAGKPAVLGGLLRVGLGVGAALACCVWLCRPLLAGLTRSRLVLPLLPLSALVVAAPLLTTFYGAIQGRNRYGLFMLLKTGESLLVLVFGTLLILGERRAGSAVGGYACAMWVALLFFLTRRNLYSVRHATFCRNREEFRALLRPLAVLAFLLLTNNYPMIVARSRLPADTAGLFAALFALRNLVLPFAFAVAVPLYSRTVSGSAEAHVFRKALIVTSGVAVGFMATAHLCPLPFFRLVLGPPYLPAAGYMGFYGIGLLLSMLCMVILFRWAASSLALSVFIVPVLVVLGMAFLPRLSIEKIIFTQICALLLCMCGASAWKLVETMRRR
ncbi:MAG: oligosaccharide flippase family protein [Kiritimatiellae bacterium]|nr:oligosaccharide flippase family protein [Kiritimatiellia bacterium]